MIYAACFPGAMGILKRFASSSTNLINPNKKIISNKSIILNLINKEKSLIHLLFKKNNLPKKVYRLNKCFLFKKRPLLTKSIKKDAVFFNFNVKNFYKSLKNEFTPYFIHTTIRLKKNQPLVSTTELTLKNKDYHSKKIKPKHFSLMKPLRSMKATRLNETLLPKLYKPILQAITHTTYYSSPINRLFKPNHAHKKQTLRVYASDYGIKKISPNRRFKENINTVISKICTVCFPNPAEKIVRKTNIAYFSNPVEKILRLKTKIKNQSLTTLEKSYELLNKQAREEKKIVMLNHQLFDIKRDTEALLQFSKKMLLSNQRPTTKTYTYDFL